MLQVHFHYWFVDVKTQNKHFIINKCLGYYVKAPPLKVPLL